MQGEVMLLHLVLIHLHDRWTAFRVNESVSEVSSWRKRDVVWLWVCACDGYEYNYDYYYDL